MPVLLVLLSLSLSVEFLVGCSSLNILPGPESPSAQTGADDRYPVLNVAPVPGEKEILKGAEEKLAERDFQKARQIYLEFISKNPNSIYLWIAKLGLAQAADGMGDLKLARKLYSEIAEIAYARQRPLSLMAHYRLSFHDEMDRKYERALGHLLTIKRNIDDLPKYFPKAEVYSRIAVFYSLLDQRKEQLEAVRDAEAELTKWEKQQLPEVRNRILPKILYRMGQSSGGIQAHRAVQPFLIRTLEFTDAPEAPLALRDLQAANAEYFADLQEQILPEPSKTNDPDDDRKKKTKKRKRMAKKNSGSPEKIQWSELVGEYATLLEEARLYQPLESKNNFQQSFFSEIIEYRREVTELIYSPRPRTPLTEAAINRINGRTARQRDATLILPLSSDEL